VEHKSIKKIKTKKTIIPYFCQIIVWSCESSNEEKLNGQRLPAENWMKWKIV